MLHIDLHDEAKGRARVGTLEEFADEFIKEVGSVTLTFRDETHKRKAKEAICRIFQRKWDAR